MNVSPTNSRSVDCGPFEVATSSGGVQAATGCDDGRIGRLQHVCNGMPEPAKSIALPQQGTSAWNRLNSKTKQHAHKLRQAMASALELHGLGRWGREEIEAAGLRDYQQAFGHAITARHWWRQFDQVLERANGSSQFDNLSLYLPGRLIRKPAGGSLGQAATTVPDLAAAVLRIKNTNSPTAAELLLVWDSAMGEYQRLLDSGVADGRARRTVIAGLDASGLPLATTRGALRRNFARKLTRWIEGGRKPSAIRDLRVENSGRWSELPLTEEDIHKLTARGLQGGVSKAYRDAMAKGELSPEVLRMYIANPASKSYVPKRVRDLVQPDVEMLQDIHHGPRQANLRGAYIPRDWSDVLPGDWYSADDTTLPLYYWEEGDDGQPRMLRGQCLVMNDCRVGRILALALHSERNYTAKVIRGLILTAHDTYGLPRQGFMFERGIWASAKLLKGTNDEVPGEETELGLREWVKFRHAKPGNARAKTVERIIGLLQTRMEGQPGYCGRNEQTEKFERLQRKLLDARSGKIHPSEFLLHRDEWAARLHEICDEYNCEAQDGKMLGGMSPREAWESLFDHSQPLMKLNQDTRYLLANHRRPLKVTRNGICVQIGKERHWFRNEFTGSLIGRILQVYFNPDDLSSVYVKLNSADTAAVVVPAAPAIPAMSATREQMHAAQASVDAHNRPSRTLYQAIKPHFPDTGPSQFRRVVADLETVEMGQEIAVEQAAIKTAQSSEDTMNRKANRLRRELGAGAHIPLKRLEIAAQLKKELEKDANPTPKL